jgi:M3 family oligoendopeptidase
MPSAFADHYRRPDLAAFESDSRALAEACATAPDAPAFLDVIRSWNALRATLDTHHQIGRVRYQQDTTATVAKAEDDFWNAAAPLLRELDVLYARTLLGSRFRGAIDAEYGPQLGLRLEASSATFAPEIKDALAEEASLTSRYVELMAKPELEFRGARLSLSAIGRYFIDADRATRLEAQKSRDAFMATHGEELDSLYDRLVTLRDGMGRALGEPSFIPLGYRLMSRIGYGPAEVAAFREALRTEIVPIAQELHARQARRIGVDRLLFHDEPVWDPTGNPRPRGDASFILAGARRMYRELGDELGDFFARLVDEDLLDVELRDGKAGGGFCTQFADLKVPFVFANFNGSEGDVVVITHECGHAFQAYSAREQPVLEYIFPTCEAAEVHSMGMELLTYPWMHLFFGDDADRYRRIHLEQALTFLPYAAAIDHFQHDVYASPTMTPAERNARWLELERRYLPHRSYGGLLPYLARGAAWQRQNHIYRMPFYYIDYALAQICALQLWINAERDRERALADYLAICRVGGSISFPDMLALGGLRSPFDPECLRDVATRLRAELS